jgi:hypothetical protein
MPNPQAGGPPFAGCLRLHIQYIRSYPPYLEAVPSIRNLRMRHAVVTRDPPNMAAVGNVLLKLSPWIGEWLFKQHTTLCHFIHIVTLLLYQICGIYENAL